MESADMSDWLSTRLQPVIHFEDSFHPMWTFARFLIEDVKVEIGNINPGYDFKYVPETGIWESGPAIWPYIKEVTVKDTSMPVLSLEIQLETNMNRELEHRIANIIDVFKREGYNSELLKFSLSEENYLSIRDKPLKNISPEEAEF
ncbi:hypothetical protein [Saccharibacillus alkalitolerans]|nr:hypothetical protein [Saccharibacillus alkalitolerans]